MMRCGGPDVEAIGLINVLFRNDGQGRSPSVVPKEDSALQERQCTELPSQVFSSFASSSHSISAVYQFRHFYFGVDLDI